MTIIHIVTIRLGLTADRNPKITVAQTQRVYSLMKLSWACCCLVKIWILPPKQQQEIDIETNQSWSHLPKLEYYLTMSNTSSQSVPSL